MLQSLRNPHSSTPPPPELSQYRRDCAFWERFGARSNPVDLDDWPLAQVLDYVTIMNLEAQVEEEKNANKGGGPSASDRAAATEDAFAKMPRVKREP